MTDRTTTGRPTAGPARAAAALVLLGALALTGCTSSNDDDSAQPTSIAPHTPAQHTPTPIPLSPREQNIADAKAALLNYIQVSDAVGQDSFHGWQEKLLPLTSGDQSEWMQDFFMQAETMGYYQVGDTLIRDLRLNDYQEDSTGNGLLRLGFEMCIDYSQMQAIMPDGHDDNPWKGRYPTSVMMQHVPAIDEQGNVLPDQPSRWAVDSFSVNYEGVC